MGVFYSKNTFISFPRLFFAFCIITLSILCVSLSTKPLREQEAVKLGRGFGDHIRWRNFKEGTAISHKYDMPILLLIHQEDCPACKDFAPKFALDRDIADLSQYFVMINCKDQEEPQGKKFCPDGKYYPRILFMSPNGEVLTDVKNRFGHNRFLYYYYTTESDSMMTTMKKFYDVEYESQGVDL